MKKEVKHSLDSLEQKVVMAQTALGLKPILPCKFNCKQSDIDETVRKLLHSLKAGNDYNKSVQILYKLFFTIFNTFVAPPTYDGADRHLMKVFLESCQPAVQGVLESTMRGHFLLTIFETRVTEKVPKETFNLRNLATLFGKELLEELKITHSMQRCVLCDLVRVSDSSVKSKHVVICISGFLQEKEDKADTWANVAKYYKNAEVFAVSWTACNAADFFDKGVYDPDKTKEFE